MSLEQLWVIITITAILLIVFSEIRYRLEKLERAKTLGEKR